jgi:protease-4
MAAVAPLAVGRRLASNAVRLVRRGVAARAMPRQRPVWVVLRMTPEIGEQAALSGLLSREPTLGLLETLEVLESAAADPRVDGVLLRFAGTPSGWSKLHSLRRAVLEVREAGKRVVAYAETLDAPGYLLASAADRIFLPEAGQLFLVGLRAESYFFRGLLDRLDVRPEVVRMGDYKSAGEVFTRDRMSQEAREQLESLMDSWFDTLVDGIATGRNLEADAVRALIDRGPFPARAAAEQGLIDGCLYPDEVESKLAELSGETESDARVRSIDAAAYYALGPKMRAWLPLTDLPRIAYVVASGAIARGPGSRGISSQGMGRLLEKLRERDSVRGVVLRIESPGGDAIASDLLWRSISRVAENKPVVASMGDVAASGGYYMAVAAHRVFAEIGTVTGSIGVVGGKLNLGGLYERIGVSKDGVERGARAGLVSDHRDFTSDERAAVKREIQGVYDIFVDRVAAGRGMSRESVEEVGGGRVWSGARARSIGLVDAVGGPLEALRAVRTRAGIDTDDAFSIDRFPRSTPLTRIAPLLRWPLARSHWSGL